MASNYRSMFLSGVTISTTTLGLVDASGTPLATANIVGSGNYAYSPTMTLNGDTDDYILTALCDGCTVEISLEMSPDGVNWCPCVLSSGSDCEFECTATAGDCTTQVIDVNLLPFVRIKIGNAGSTGGTCSVGLYHELEEQAEDGSLTSGKADNTIEQEVTYGTSTPQQNQKVT
jgi:hypothetical protein